MSLHENKRLIPKFLTFLLFRVIQPLVFQNNTLNHFFSELIFQYRFTSGIDTASLISFHLLVQKVFLSGNRFSEVLVPTAVAPIVRLPDFFHYRKFIITQSKTSMNKSFLVFQTLNLNIRPLLLHSFKHIDCNRDATIPDLI